MNDKNCETCKWRSDDFTSACVNGESEHCADFVSEDDWCEEWEEMGNNIMSACGLESRPRWIDIGAINGHRYSFMCSNCGETVHKRLLPKICPNCKAEMKLT